MTNHRSTGPNGVELRRTVDRDGVVEVALRRGRWERWYLVVGFAALVVVGMILVRPWRPSGGASHGRPPARTEQGAPVASGRAKSPTAPAPATRPGDPMATPRDIANSRSPGDAANPGAPGATTTAEPSAADNPSEAGDSKPPAQPLRAAIPGFPAPGTKRIKQGVVVPDDFELPPGYMRHYQTTDKGRMLEPILMFHPDHKPVDADGNPIPLPADRVVPADMVPPGLPPKLLEVPEDAYADSDSEDGSNIDPGSTSVEEEPRPADEKR